jgi:hypothetical protein
MIEIQKRLLDEQTIFITESSKTCGDNCICCLLNNLFIEITSQIIPTLPSFNKKKGS